MKENELSMLQEFSLNLQTVETVITSRMMQSINIPNVAINLSPLLNAPLFCPLRENNSNQMSIQSFLKLFISRWHQEIQYQQEILNLKDQIINEFDQLCNQMKDEKLLEAARKQCQQIVETLFIKTNFDKKHQAGDFCKSFMNGFELEMIEKINYYATYVVWTPFIVPLPGELVEYVKKIIHKEIDEASNEENVLSVSGKIIKYIENQLQEKEIQIQGGILGMVKKFSGSNDLPNEKTSIAISKLEETLKLAQVNRKSCFLLVEKVGKNDKIILKERERIQTICVRMDAKKFLKADIPFTYEHLELIDLEDRKDWGQVKQILIKLPKCLKSATLNFQKNKQNEIKIINNEQKHIYELSFGSTQTQISYDQMQRFADFCTHSQFPLPIIIPKFEYQPGENGVSNEITTLSTVFTHSKAFEYLALDFTHASISTSAIDSLSISLDGMSQIQNLFLAFGGMPGSNSANDHSMQLLAQAVNKMIKLSHLRLYFWGANHLITDDGIVQLSQSLIKLNNIQQLVLNFSQGKNRVSEKAINVLSQSIAKFLNLLDLNLKFHKGNHCVGDEGIQSLGRSLMENQKLEKLYLEFNGGMNSAADNGIKDLSQSIANLKNIQELYLDFSTGNNSISDVGIQALASALVEAIKLTKLYLQFNDGNNSISDVGAKFLAEALAVQKLPLDFTFFIGEHPNTVTEIGIDYLKKARNYSRFAHYQK